jgi:hypothetical protein
MSKWVSRKAVLSSATTATVLAALAAVVGAGSKWW